MRYGGLFGHLQVGVLRIGTAAANCATAQIRTEINACLHFRFIPNREGQDLQASFSLLHDDASPATPSKAKKRTPHGELHFQKSE